MKELVYKVYALLVIRCGVKNCPHYIIDWSKDEPGR